MRKTAILKNDLFLEHIPDFNHVESPDRLRIIYEQLEQPPLNKLFLYPDFAPASLEALELNHTKEHVMRVAGTAGKAFSSLDPDTQASPKSFDAACLAAGAVIGGMEMIVQGEADNGFALVRPPGHHAEAGRAMGFCLFNNVAVGALHGLQNLGLQRIAIIDWDLHHGNGTQHIFEDERDLLYLSTHRYPFYPGTGGPYDPLKLNMAERIARAEGASLRLIHVAQATASDEQLAAIDDRIELRITGP